MITKFGPHDRVGTKIPVPNGEPTGYSGTIRIVAAQDQDKIQYEVELDKAMNGNSFMWFYEDELFLLGGRKL
jgi:hypothetical protein